jgi:hypothetical protein
MANKALEFHPEARAEARVSLLWYRRRSVRTGEAFLAELDQAIETILQAPDRLSSSTEINQRQCKSSR